MRALGIALAAVLSAGARPAMSQQYGPQPDAATRSDILALREAAWRAWFANDQAGFRRIVPDELVALGWDGGTWDDGVGTMTQMGEFAKSGRKVVSLEFPRNVFQAYGDVVILYTTFRIVLADPEGRPQETTGRGTEVFVRREGRWVHTAWHLDTVGS